MKLRRQKLIPWLKMEERKSERQKEYKEGKRVNLCINELGFLKLTKTVGGATQCSLL